MKKIAVLHIGGGWITNIGNAFLDIGSVESVHLACPDAEIYFCSVLNRWLTCYIKRGVMDWIFHRKPSIKNVFNIHEYIHADYVIQSGAFLGEDWFNIHGELLLKLVSKGCKLIINGGGMTDKAYNEKEIEKTRKFLKKLKPYAFISRDEKSFESFEDLAEHSYNGIDCAFFVCDAFKPPTLNVPPYVVLNFDKRPEPSKEELGIENKKQIIRVHHSIWHNFAFTDYFKMRKEYYFKENVMISEIPYDYLTIYANADATYSDRVHACVVSLAYGTPARLFSNTPRAYLLERIGAGKILHELTKPDKNKIKKEKEKQIIFLREVMNVK